MSTASETILALEKALEAGPTSILFTHELLDHKGKPNGVHLGVNERAICEQAYDEGGTSKEVREWFACSPLAIRTLLDAHASALRDAAKLREALKKIAAIEDSYTGTDWDEINEAREIARAALDDNTKGAAE